MIEIIDNPTYITDKSGNKKGVILDNKIVCIYKIGHRRNIYNDI